MRRATAALPCAAMRSLSLVVSAALVGVARGLTAGQTPPPAAHHACAASSRPALLGRRAATGALLGGLLGAPLGASANTQPMLDKPMEQFETGEARRAEFLKKQKVFKKQWRSALAELEFCSNDAEALDAIQRLVTLIGQNNGQIPEGIRKMDLDQVRRLPACPGPVRRGGRASSLRRRASLPRAMCRCTRRCRAS